MRIVPSILLHAVMHGMVLPGMMIMKQQTRIHGDRPCRRCRHGRFGEECRGRCGQYDGTGAGRCCTRRFIIPPSCADGFISTASDTTTGGRCNGRYSLRNPHPLQTHHPPIQQRYQRPGLYIIKSPDTHSTVLHCLGYLFENRRPRNRFWRRDFLSGEKKTQQISGLLKLLHP